LEAKHIDIERSLEIAELLSDALVRQLKSLSTREFFY